MAPRVGRPAQNDAGPRRKPIPDALKQTTTSEGVMKGVQPPVGTDSGGRTVTVACNLPNGLILRLFKWVDDRGSPPDKHGDRPKIAVPDGTKQPVRINGWAIPFGKTPRFIVAGGYALTTGVDKDFWDTWVEQNKGASYLEEKMVFAMPTPHEAEQEAVQHGRKSGFEPLDPDKMPTSGSKHLRLEKDDGK